jgi:hypothetical protein
LCTSTDGNHCDSALRAALACHKLSRATRGHK